jgi:integrase
VSQKIEGVQKIEAARLCVLDSYLALKESDTRPTQQLGSLQGQQVVPKVQRVKKHPISDLIEQFLAHQKTKVELGQLGEDTLRYKTKTLTVMRDYLKGEGIIYANDLEATSYENYPQFRRVGKLTLKQELMQMREWCRYLKDHMVLTADIRMPKVKLVDNDYSSNPPWDGEDMKLFWKELHTWVSEGEEHNNSYVLHYRRMVWTYFAVLRTSGMRPKEALSLTWKDVEIENIGRESKSQARVVDRYVAHIAIKNSKTGSSREVTANCGDRLLAWLRWSKEFKVRTCSSPSKCFDLSQPVFSTIKNGEYVVPNPVSFHKSFHKVMDRLEGKLRGARLTNRPYTIYSFRATRAQELLELGVDVALAAKQLGHSPTMMMKVYARLPLRERATKEAARIEFGKTNQSLGRVNLLE